MSIGKWLASAFNGAIMVEDTHIILLSRLGLGPALVSRGRARQRIAFDCSWPDYPRSIDSPPTKWQDYQIDDIALIWVQLGYEVAVYEAAL